MKLDMVQDDNYLNKLKQVLELIAKDIPDKYDDTLNTKLLDSIRDKLLLNTNDIHLIDYLSEFLLEQFKIENFNDKDNEIKVFLINLASVYFECKNYKCSNEVVKFIENYLDQYFDNYLTDASLRHAFIHLILTLLKFDINVNNLVEKYVIHEIILKNDNIFIQKLIFECLVVYCDKNTQNFELIFRSIFDKCDILALDLSTSLMNKQRSLIIGNYFTELKLNDILSKLNVHLIKPFVNLWFNYINQSYFQMENFTIKMFKSNQNANLLYFKLLNNLLDLVNDENYLKYLIDLYIQPLKFVKDNRMNLFGIINEKNINQLLKNCLYNLSEIVFKNQKVAYQVKINVEDINAILLSTSNLVLKKNLFNFLINYAKFLNQNDAEALFNVVYDFIKLDFDNNFNDSVFKFFLNLKSDNKLSLIKDYLKQNTNNLSKIDALLTYMIEIEDKNELIDLLEYENDTKFIDFLIQTLKEVTNKLINDELDFNSIIYLKINILRLFKKVLEIGLVKIYLINRLNIDCIFELIGMESEAMLRREYILFLNELFQHLNGCESKYFEFYANLIQTDFDSDVQLNCLEFVKFFTNRNKTQKLNLQLFKKSLLFQLLLDISNEGNIYDRIVKEEIYSFLNGLKINSYFTEEFDLKEDYESKLNALKNSNDLYLRNPISILNDIISSYEFNLNDVKKISDCY